MAEKKEKFKCIYCEQSFDDETQYDNHRDKIMCMCYFCGEIFKGIHQRSQHFSEHYSNGIFKCFMCTVTTNDERLMIHHISLHQKRLFKCKKCEARFCLKFDLADHIKKHKEHWECDDCKFTTKTLKDLEEHKKCHECYSEEEFTPIGLQLRDRFKNETIFITKTTF